MQTQGHFVMCFTMQSEPRKSAHDRAQAPWPPANRRKDIGHAQNRILIYFIIQKRAAQILSFSCPIAFASANGRRILNGRKQCKPPLAVSNFLRNRIGGHKRRDIEHVQGRFVMRPLRHPYAIRFCYIPSRRYYSRRACPRTWCCRRCCYRHPGYVHIVRFRFWWRRTHVMWVVKKR